MADPAPAEGSGRSSVRGQHSSRANAMRQKAEKRVEAANALTASEFFARYDPSHAVTTALQDDHADLEVGVGDPRTVPGPLLEACLALIERTSAFNYQHSEMGWSASKKRKEMRLPDMKYITLTDRPTAQLAGFVSFMVTYEDGAEVVYVYEIHLVSARQGHGIGQHLLHGVEAIARHVGVTKVMLTVFRANTRAVEWYARLGYGEDEFSPGPRTLRNGSVKEPSYIILSKRLSS